MKARMTQTKIGMTLLTVLSLMVVAAGCKTSSKKKSAAKAVPSATPIPTVAPTPTTDTSTNSFLNITTGLECSPNEISENGLSDMIIKVDFNRNRMTVLNTTSKVILAYALTPKKDDFYDKGQYEVRLDTTLLPANVPAPEVVVGELNKNLTMSDKLIRYKFSNIHFLDNSAVSSSGGTKQEWIRIGTPRLGLGIRCNDIR